MAVRGVVAFMLGDRAVAPEGRRVVLVERAETSSDAASTALASLIVVAYNGRDHLERCLRSILSQDTCPDEIIVVDNASSDGGADFVEQTFPSVVVVRSQVNRGFGHGANVGARIAHGDYLVFLNPDTVVEPGWLTGLVAALEAHPEAGLATARILLLRQPDRVNACGTEVHFTGLALCRGVEADRDHFPEIEEVGAVSGAAFAIRQTAFREIAGFDERFFLYMEDIDLSWRARLAGYTCLYAPGSVVGHDYALAIGANKVYLEERNRYLMLLKNLRWPTLLALIPALILAEVVTWGFVLLCDRPHALNKPRAYFWVARHWWQILASRRETRVRRRIRDRDLLARCAHRIAFEQVGKGHQARLAHRVFDPSFLVLWRLTLALVRW
ncbi:MAG: glycosyltransferase family 2 protein [Chloroflexota bacterium]